MDGPPARIAIEPTVGSAILEETPEAAEAQKRGEVMLLESRTCTLYAEQGFYLSDAASNPGDSNFDDVVRTRVATSPHGLSVLLCPEEGDADVTLEVVVEVHDGPPPLDGGGWEHIVEASLHLESGQLLVHTIDENEEFAVSPGWYRARSYHAPFAPVEEVPLPHRVEIWPAPPADVTVLSGPAPE